MFQAHSAPQRPILGDIRLLARRPLSVVRPGILLVLRVAQRAVAFVMRPINLWLAHTRAHNFHPNSVLHVSYPVHVAYNTTRILRRHGITADYLALGESSHWNRSDFRIKSRRAPLSSLLGEFTFFWRTVAKYQILHLHFGLMMSETGWELPILKRMGRKIVVHFRGCEARDKHLNQRLHPDLNICEQCDYDAYCIKEPNRSRIRRVREYGDAFLVTTPDLRDFVPQAKHFPFFAPDGLQALRPKDSKDKSKNRRVRVVHVTNHPGLEGSREIEETINRLIQRGYALEFRFLRGVAHHEVLKALADADLSIGKMKMGYYSNFQIESMALGVPAITYVRPEFMTDELRNSGFIFATLDTLEETLAFYLEHPDALEEKRRIARSSILRLHDNDALAARMIDLYRALHQSSF